MEFISSRKFVLYYTKNLVSMLVNILIVSGSRGEFDQKDEFFSTRYKLTPKAPLEKFFWGG